jgi:endonuclease/exonuclease/phosphatase family metal-dependent hydrolase
LNLLVRTWNVYHGRTHPQTRRLHLERMVRLVTEDRPDVVALQEVPLWALGRLERWSGMAVRWAVTVPALLLAPIARLVTELNPVRLRSLVSGQANALLVSRRFELGEQRLLLLTPEVTKWEWLFERGLQQRYCQRLELEGDGRKIVVANLHSTNNPDLARAEAGRAAEFLADAPRVVLCGDFNAPRFALPGYSPPIEGIDQILVRGLEFEREPFRWERERRMFEGRVLSDHPPVEAVVA